MDDNKLITLKEAAQISGYTADYIGQLIRNGKISGKQVYANITWMTTADEVMDYKNNSANKKAKGGLKTFTGNNLRKINMQIDMIRLFFKTFRLVWPVVIIAILSFIMLCAYLINLAFDVNQSTQNPPAVEINQELTF